MYVWGHKGSPIQKGEGFFGRGFFVKANQFVDRNTKRNTGIVIGFPRRKYDFDDFFLRCGLPADAVLSDFESGAAVLPAWKS